MTHPNPAHAGPTRHVADDAGHQGVGRRAFLGMSALVAASLAGCTNADPTPGNTSSTARLVTLDGATAGLALLLGQAQVGTVSFLGRDPLVRAIGRLQPGDVVDVAEAAGDVDLERLVSLDPTLLVGFRFPGRGRAQVGSFTAIRLIERTGRIGTDAAALGDAMGIGRPTRAAVSGLEKSQRAIAGRLDRGARPTVSLLSPGLDGSSLYTLSGATPAGAALAALGLARPTEQQGFVDVAMPFRQISPERITDHDADLILLLTGPTADPAFLRDDPLWQRLDAVRSGNVIEVDALRWAALSSLLDAWWVSDDLKAILLRGEPPVIGADSPAGIARIRGYRDRYAD